MTPAVYGTHHSLPLWWQDSKSCNSEQSSALVRVLFLYHSPKPASGFYVDVQQPLHRAELVVC